MLLAACTPASSPGTGGASAEGELPQVTILAGPVLPVQVAIAEGCYEEEGIIVEHDEVVGDADTNALFISGDAELGYMAAWELARFVSEGEPIITLSSTAGQNMVNGIAVRSEDADQYQSLPDLVGGTLAIPGFGSGTWAAFEVFAAEVYDINAREDFEIVTVDPGAALGLLSTGEVDAALLFSGQTASAMANPEFHLVFSFTEDWQEATGQMMLVTTIAAKRDWAEANPDLVEAVIGGSDCGVQWMRENPDEFREGGKYEDLADSEGWLEEPQTTDEVLERLAAGEWFVGSDVYTPEWIDATYRFIESGQGTLVEEVPAEEDIFYPPLN
jgi:ABC-type nitrate/sulfonate/bicarbonate transport system substrate-binding protein